MKILFGVTSPPSALIFLRGQLEYLARSGHVVHLACPDTEDMKVTALCKREGAHFHATPMARDPNPASDLRSLGAIVRTVARVRPDVVVAGTPKMSLLMLASAALLRTPHRVYLCHGLRFEGTRGAKRLILTVLERLLCALSTRTVAVSDSVMDGLNALGVPKDKLTVLGNGSPNGVDTRRFRTVSNAERTGARRDLGLANETPVVLFVGRLTGDKGIRALLELAEHGVEMHLLLAGAQQPDGASDIALTQALTRHQRTTYVGRIEDVEKLYAACDLLVLPTKREGLPTVILEAASMGIPTVAMRATGTVDAVVHGQTGLLVDQGNTEAFISAVDALIEDVEMRTRLGRAARKHVEAHFDQEHVWNSWDAFLRSLGSPTRG